MERRLIRRENMTDFIIRVFEHLNVSRTDAEVVANNLVLSSLRGIDSHGVARLIRYVNGIKTGFIIPDIKPGIVRESRILANVDAKNGLGQVAGHFGMKLAIEKASANGIGFVTVFNSNHYGFAGFYSLMALESDLIGISMTNAQPLTVATYGKNALFGTNPIAVAAPTKRNKPWVMDFATSVVPLGKLEVYDRLDRKIPDGWATDENGLVTNDPGRVIRNLASQTGGGILPIGGFGEFYGGHKGYGLTVMVDILCGVLSGSNFGPDVVSKKNDEITFPRVGHLFLTLNPKHFVGLEEFKNNLDDYLELIRNSEKAQGEPRIYIHGEKEFEEQDRREKSGIPLDKVTTQNLLDLSEEYNEPISFIGDGG